MYSPSPKINTNPMGISSAAPGNVPCYSISINLYPTPDAATSNTNTGILSSGNMITQGGNISKPYFPPQQQQQLWSQKQPQNQQIAQNGRNFSIPVPIPNSLYQVFQNCPPNISSGNLGSFSQYSPNPFPQNATTGNNNKQSNYSINCEPYNYHLNPNRSFLKTRQVINSYSSRLPAIPPLPPPPPPQYSSVFSHHQNNDCDSEIDKLTLINSLKNTRFPNHKYFENELSELHKSLVDTCKECSRSKEKSSADAGKHLSHSWRTLTACKPENKNQDHRHCCNFASCRNNRFETQVYGGGDCGDCESPKEIANEKCNCGTCCEDSIDEKNASQETQKAAPSLPSKMPWTKTDPGTILEDKSENPLKFLDKATSAKHETVVDYDSSPVWEFQKRNVQKFPKCLSASRISEKGTQCDLDGMTPSSSTEIIWKRKTNISASASRIFRTYSSISCNDHESTAYVDYTPSVNRNLQVLHNCNRNNFGVDSEYDIDDCNDIGTPNSSQIYHTRRPTFEEVMEYLEKADEQEKKREASPTHIQPSKPIHQQKCKIDEECEEQIQFESPYKYTDHFQTVNPPKTKPRRKINMNHYRQSYTDVICKEPIGGMFPEHPEPLDFPQNSVMRALTFLDSIYWQQVLDGFRLVVRLARHHPEVLCPDLGPIVWKSEKHIASLKSCVSRAALSCFKELFTHIGKAMEPYVDKILGKILLKSMDCNKFLRWECRNVLNAMVNSFPIGKSLSCIEMGCKHKSGVVRATISAVLHNWVRKVGADKIFASYADRIIPMIISFLQERLWEPRSEAKNALNCLSSHPEFMGVLRAVMPYETLFNAARQVKCIRELIERDSLNFRI